VYLGLVATMLKRLTSGTKKKGNNGNAGAWNQELMNGLANIDGDTASTTTPTTAPPKPEVKESKLEAMMFSALLTATKKIKGKQN
jgi:ADP-dependent phosphofructokinase/glucokinase